MFSKIPPTRFTGLILGFVMMIFPVTLPALTVNSVEFHGLDMLSENYVRPYITLVPGGEYSPEELEEAIALSIARAEASPVINFVFIDWYEDDQGRVDVLVEFLERSFLWTFYGGNAYAVVGHYNLLGPGSLLQLSLGYNRHRLELGLPFDGSAPLGVAVDVDHRLQNAYRPDEFRSRVTAKAMPYYDITPFLQLGIIGQYRVYRDWAASQTLNELSVGFGIQGIHQYYQQLGPLASRFSAEYRYVFWGEGSGTHIMNGTGLLDILITDSLHISLEGFVAGQTSEDTVELLHTGVPGDDDNTGRRAWRGTMIVPLRLITTGESIPIDIGVNPQFHIGHAGKEFMTSEPSMAVGGGVYVDIGFPVGIRLAPEFFYQIKEKKLTFRFEVSFLAWH